MRDCLDQVSLWVRLWEIILIMLMDLEDPAHCGQLHSLRSESWTVQE